MKLELEPFFGDFKPSHYDLVNLETYLSLELPADYKAFLTAYNGGYARRKPDDLALVYFFKAATQNNRAIESFFGIPYPIGADWILDEDTLYSETSGNSFYSLIYQYKVTWDYDFQSVFFPIAKGLGTTFCLSMRPEDYGKIYCMTYEGDLFDFDADGIAESIRDVRPDFESFTELMKCSVESWP